MTKPPFIYKVKWEGQGGTRHIKNLVFAPIDFSVPKADERLLKASNEIHEFEKSAKTWEDCLEGSGGILKKYGFVKVDDFAKSPSAALRGNFVVAAHL